MTWLARLGSCHTNRTPTRATVLSLIRETFHPLLPFQDDGGDVPQLRQLLVQRVAILVGGRIRILAGLGGVEHIPLVNKPVATRLELLWSTSLSQAARHPLVILYHRSHFII